MVLEDASRQGGFSESPQDGDYASTDSTDSLGSQGDILQRNMIDYNKLPKVNPIIGLLQGINEEKARRTLLNELQSIEKAIQTPLTQAQCQTLAYEYAKYKRTESWGRPLGFAAGFYRFYTTSRTGLRFPFYQPGPSFDINKLLFLSGRSAGITWRFLSFAAYTTLGQWIGHKFSAAYAGTGLAVAIARSPEMQIIRKHATDRFSRDASRSGQTTSDDANAAPGAMPQSESQSGLGDGQSQSQPQIQTPSRWQPMSRHSSSPNGQQQQREQDSQSPVAFDFDDASPTSGAGMMEIQSAPGSAWDQVRKGNTRVSPASEQQTSPQRDQTGANAWANLRNSAGRQEQQRNDEFPGSSYSVGQEEAERQRARRRAQQDFDDRLERERRGESFDDNSRWK